MRLARPAWLIAFTLALGVIVTLAVDARAHGMRSAYLEIREVAPGHALARFAQTAPADDVQPQFPDACAVERSGHAVAMGDAAPTTYRLVCEKPVSELAFGVLGLGPRLTEAALVVVRADGSSTSHLLTPSASSWSPSETTVAATARAYVRMGFAHILSGADHLLFLVLLVLTVRAPRKVLLAETAFTLSHSISFSATALGLVHIASAPAEACIALSLVLLALDVGRTDAPSGRQATALAFVFGLVHGLGFAGGLREIGMPDDHVAWALIGFGAGIEVGQIAFLVGILGLVHAARRARWRAPVSVAVAYGAGAIATYWLIERVIASARGA